MVAAANWHALATFASRFLSTEGNGFLIDIGSTTTDVTSFRDLIRSLIAGTQPVTDLKRLMAESRNWFIQESGGRRLTALLDHRFNQWASRCRVANELFATIS